MIVLRRSYTINSLSLSSLVCDANVDMVFMLDQSGSVGQYNHDIALYFLRDVISFYNISPNATQVTFNSLTHTLYLDLHV